MVAAGVKVRELRATGGGARSDLWRQLLADILRLPVYRTVVDEGPAYGAALLGGVASGVYANVDESTSVIKLRRQAEQPNPERAELYRRYHAAYADFYPVAASLMHRLADLASDGSFV